jgi:DeoR/GlpR family transcriptional regulator of sugar metabolism
MTAPPALETFETFPPASSGLTPGERRERIAGIVLANESVSARDLATRFAVSLMTIHRDLDELERRGVLGKTGGGGTPQPTSEF